MRYEIKVSLIAIVNERCSVVLTTQNAFTIPAKPEATPEDSGRLVTEITHRLQKALSDLADGPVEMRRGRQSAEERI